MAGPGDLTGFKRLIDGGALDPARIVAVIAKTEGNGCVNDHTRAYTTFAWQVFLGEVLGASREEIARRVAFVMSGGTEGVLSPHATVFAAWPATGRPSHGGKRFAVGVEHTQVLAPDEIGRIPQARKVAAAVAQGMERAGIDRPEDVHFVQVKCPLLSSDTVEEARRRETDVVTADTYESMGASRGASALGVALGLGEIAEETLTDDIICRDWTLYSNVASTSAGVELMNCEVVVMGNSPRSASDLVIAHGVMTDAVDAEGVREALRRGGLRVDGSLDPEDAGRLVNVFAKAEADPTGRIRGRRHTMLDDSDINSTRHARAVVGAVIASIVGDPMIYVSGGAEHQGPPGGGPVAVLVRAG
jgi:cyanuric acid amidohydrolase